MEKSGTRGWGGVCGCWRMYCAIGYGCVMLRALRPGARRGGSVREGLVTESHRSSCRTQSAASREGHTHLSGASVAGVCR